MKKRGRESTKQEAREAAKEVIRNTKYAIRDLKNGLPDAVYQAAHDVLIWGGDLDKLNLPLADKIAKEVVEELL